MADRVVHTLITLSERGAPRGATAVLDAARRQARVAAGPAPPKAPRMPARRRLAPVFAFAAVALVTVGGLIGLLATRDTVDTPTTDPTVPPTTTTTTEPPTAPAIGPTDEVSDMALAPDGTLWTATEAGVVAWDLDASTPTAFGELDGLGGRDAGRIAVGADGTVWAAGDSWLAWYDGHWTTVGDDVLAVIDDPLGGFAAGPDGAAWLAVGDALVRVDRDGFDRFGIPDEALMTTPWARSLAVAQDGTVWASTFMSGVYAFDGGWQHFGVGTGLPSDVIGDIAVAPDGTVWVGGEGSYGEPGGDILPAGVLRYRNGVWTTFTTADGLLGDEGTVTVGATGEVWVVHSPLPDGIAEQLGVELVDGISHFDGTTWRQYPGLEARGPGVVDDDGTLWLAGPDGIIGFDGTSTTHLIVGVEGVPQPAPPTPPVDPVSMEPVEGLDAIRLSTSIGEIEFTTWVHPDGDEPPWPMTETAHGVIGGMGPDGAMAWSVDGVTWTPIPEATDGWSDRWPADSDDLVVWSVDDGVVRARWDGSAWVDAEFHHDPRLDGATDTLVGPHGIIVVGDEIYRWDGTEYAAASRPPDPALHPGSSSACSAHDWLGWGLLMQLGPVVATDDGFIALAPRYEDDWHSLSVCEPIVWLSADGDEWVPVTEESPFGEGAVVRDLAVVGNTIVAGGGMSYTDATVWVSGDGVTWDRVDLDGDHVLQVAGSDRGWIAAGGGNTMWFSPDGRVWDGPYERPVGWAESWGYVGVAMLDDWIIGVGELRIATEQSATSGLVVGVFVDG